MSNSVAAIPFTAGHHIDPPCGGDCLWPLLRHWTALRSSPQHFTDAPLWSGGGRYVRLGSVLQQSSPRGIT